MREIIRAWAAGFFDGEGNISIQPKKHFSLDVTVGSTDRGAIDFLVEQWGACYRAGAKAGQYKSKQDVHIAIFFPPNREVAAKFLADILPYLRIKQRQAQIALRWLKEIGQFDGLRAKRGNRLLGIEKEWRKQMWEEMKNLGAESLSTGLTRPRLF